MEPTFVGYLQRVSSLPVLNEEEERALARRWRESGDQAARNLLVQSQLRFVLTVARRYHHSGAGMNELVAEGNLGLLYAASKFDPERGFRFVTYAKYWVRVYVAECAFRSFNSGVPSTRTLRRARREHARAATLAGEGLPARRVMGERLKLSEEQVDALLEMIERRQVSFELLSSQGSLNQSHFSCSDASPEQALVERAEQDLRAVAIRGALALLTERERAIVKHRLMGDESTALTLKELGDEFGVSRERVRQLEERLKRKLAENLRSALGADPARSSSAAA